MSDALAPKGQAAVTPGRSASRGARLADAFPAACGALYVVLLVAGDDFINPAGEVPGVHASAKEITSYVERADAEGYWLGRSIGLIGLCALLVFVAHLAGRIRAAELRPGTLSGLALVSGALIVVLQFMAAPAQFAAVLGKGELDPELTRSLLRMNASFGLSFLPLGVFLGCVAVAGLRHHVVPPWLALAAAPLALALVVGLVGRPQDPSVVAYIAFALGLLWFVTASLVLVREQLSRHDAAAAPPL